ncbi:hypothetical protein CKO44_08415 [Rubrivivax gelatinosus]|uniref:TM2 domain-containing protein n=1 Tax=Rubrivivax gelatinosus TaxID=28068 RepID=A0ABS1DUY9_RUBGE|nr:TM2 domain-containing protein [Rubrivivax gelatinosus]MBK1613493.1 hypothetical protein [Rubrivivax gelatinosus]MBK1713194.1 hypothetical protein [Rubrivivax gelatinosus]
MGYRSKTVATWIAFALGAFGAHRFYLHGRRDALGWLHTPPTLAGLAGVVRMRELGQDDRLAWLLIPLLGLMLSQAMLCAIVYALTPDDRWDARRNPKEPGRATGWGPVLGAIASLMVGGAVLMGTIAFAGQRFFEWQLEDGAEMAPAGTQPSRV